MKYKTLIASGLALTAGSLYICNQSTDYGVSQNVSKPQKELKHVQNGVCSCGVDHSMESSPDRLAQVAKKQAEVVKLAEGPVNDFRQWLEMAKQGQLTEAQQAEGLELVQQRKESMLSLMEFAPEQAIENALSWAEYEALPDDLKPYVEKPFSSSADFNVMPVCGNPELGTAGQAEPNYELVIDGKVYDLAAYDRYLDMSSKKGMPVQGIQLDGKAAVRTLPLQALDAADHAAVAGDFIVANPDPNYDFYTGNQISGQAQVAVAGGQLYYFENLASLNAFNARLAALDLLNGPHAGSRMIYQAYAADGEEVTGVDMAAMEESAQLQASAWTETKKDVFYIRVDLSDEQGASVGQAELANIVNGVVSDSINDMSYGKTWIEADVSSTVVRLPQPKSYYLPNNNEALRNDAIAAFNALNTGITLSSYDIVGVHFASIGMTGGGGFAYAGLAGGEKQWLQGTTNSGVIIHEFGHNYGLGHAHYWNTGGSSVVGSGSTEEYGNIFDIMGDGPDPEGHFHPQAKSKLNWLESTDWADTATSGSGTYRIYRGDHADSAGIRGLRVEKGNGTNQYYWVGYRTAINDEYLQRSAVLNWQKTSTGNSWLLDTTPGSTDGKNDSAISLGRTYSDTSASPNVHITPVAVGGSGADQWIDVTVNVGNFVGNSAPTASISGPSSGDARTTLTFSAVASDSDGDELAYSWDFGDGKILANQDTVSHKWVLGGNYTVKVTVSDMKGGTVTKTINVEVNETLNSWSEVEAGNGLNLYDITHGGGKAVAVGKWGVFYTSTDGTNWTAGDMGQNDYLFGIAYGAGRYVAVGQDNQQNSWAGVINSSVNGTSWSEEHFGGSRLRDVAYGNSMFVAVGDQGSIMKSTDGTSWSEVSSGTSSDFNSVAFGDGNFVAVGVGGLVMTSVDGSNWVDRSAGFGDSGQIHSVEYESNLFIADGFYTNLRYSEDGGETFSTNRSSISNERYRAFAYGNGVFFAGGFQYIPDPNNEGYVIEGDSLSLVSVDGKNWTTLSANQLGGNEAIFFNNTFITVHDDGKIWQSDEIPALPGVVVWQDEQFAGESENTGYGEDFDGDGVLNIFEYITGTDAKDPSSHAGPLMTEESGYLTLTLDKATGIDGVTLSVEASKDLTSWDTTGITVITDTENQLKARLALPLNDPGAKEKFLRIKATVQ